MSTLDKTELTDERQLEYLSHCPRCGQLEFEQEQSVSKWNGRAGVYWVCGNCDYTEFVDLEGDMFAPYEDNGALKYIGRIIDWQEANPSRCPRCGRDMDRPVMNRAHADRRINLCDGCATIEAIIYSPDIITKGRERTQEDFWDENTWTALAYQPGDAEED